LNRFAKSKYSKRRSHELENDETIEQNKKDLFFQPSKKRDKVEMILKGSLDMILSPLPIVKIQIMDGKV
jgi:hypothetical protein